MTERVFVVPRKQTSSRVYHSDPDCRLIRGDAFSRDRDVAESWGFTACQVCGGEFSPGDNQQSQDHLNSLKAAARGGE